MSHRPYFATFATVASGIARKALHFVLPPKCVGCDSYLDADMLCCERCAHAVFEVEGPICLVCGEPRSARSGKAGRGYAGIDEVCARCIERQPRFEQARALWEYTGVIAEALQRAKYRRQLWALRSLAAPLRPWLTTQIEALGFAEPPLLTTVPMHIADLRRRGFNAASMLCRLAISDHPIVDYEVRDDVLQKTSQTPAQAGLGRLDRLSNVRGAFSCRRPDLVKGRQVVLFDDVMTTGATASEVARTLCRAGAAGVCVLTAARSVS